MVNKLDPKELMKVDDSQTVVICFENKFYPVSEQPVYRIGYRCWLMMTYETEDDWEAALEKLKNSDVKVKMMWPQDLNVKSAKETLKGLKGKTFEAVVVKIMAYGEHLLMKVKLKHLIAIGKTTPKKEDRRLIAKKNLDENGFVDTDKKKGQGKQNRKRIKTKKDEGKEAALGKVEKAKAARAALLELKNDVEKNISSTEEMATGTPINITNPDDVICPQRSSCTNDDANLPGSICDSINEPVSEALQINKVVFATTTSEPEEISSKAANLTSLQRSSCGTVAVGPLGVLGNSANEQASQNENPSVRSPATVVAEFGVKSTERVVMSIDDNNPPDDQMLTHGGDDSGVSGLISNDGRDLSISKRLSHDDVPSGLSELISDNANKQTNDHSDEGLKRPPNDDSSDEEDINAPAPKTNSSTVKKKKRMVLYSSGGEDSDDGGSKVGPGHMSKKQKSQDSSSGLDTESANPCPNLAQQSRVQRGKKCQQKVRDEASM
ncbi:hypothetical protein QAD02_014769 [Eretmocerus hayati]|uniref:Uncharacterized protein n=1 Tax=Eretmocerus hayati TaxID=131215 RepID=A0ACC2P6N9_9HYME|nr:hypothetical protein QAD02_014769 [Eretmocerus hayati]